MVLPDDGGTLSGAQVAHSLIPTLSENGVLWKHASSSNGLNVALTDGGPRITSNGASEEEEDEGGDMAANDTDTHTDVDDEPENEGRRLVLNEPRKPRTMTEKKRVDNAAFEAWLERNQADIGKKRQSEKVDDMSTLYMVANLENHKIIESPRDYQVELFERAKAENTIAVLDTGAGKTLIAALLLRHYIEKELACRARGEHKRVSFFLVDKVALVFQQYTVLDCNLDCSIGRIYGDMLKSSMGKDYWRNTFSEHMVVVCTAEILRDCLQRSYIRMDEINLLIFDEAHHTKKNHPYARIIKDHFIALEDETKRPRILGMTASPVDAQTEVVKAAAELEGLLQSRIATVSDPALLRNSICRPKDEMDFYYDRLPMPTQSALYMELFRLIGGNSVFKKMFAFASEASAQLGQWCADRVWQLIFLGDEELGKFEAKTQRNFLKETGGAINDLLEKNTTDVRKALLAIQKHPFPPLLHQHSSLSSKVLGLLEKLGQHFDGQTAINKCIVFVDKRLTAVALADLLDQPIFKAQMPLLKVGVLMGAGSTEMRSVKVSVRDQLLTVTKFKRGDINCIIATSVAEEGLDIPDCNLVIRFDLYRTMIQYIQSRGRARHENSKYIHMLERGNLDHRRLRMQNKHNEELLKAFCAAQPEDRILSGNDFNMDYFLQKEKRQRVYTIPSTGAKLNYKVSIQILSCFVASLPHPEDTNPLPEYFVTPKATLFECEVLLPETSPIRSASGNVHTTKQVAKCSAAFEMCLQLLKKKYLDEHLHPIFTKKLPAMRNARLAVSSKKKSEYAQRSKPKVWSALGKADMLFVTFIALADPSALGRSSRPLAILTRRQLPPIAPPCLFFGTHRSSAIVWHPASVPVGFSDREQRVLRDFSLRIFKDVFSKEYEAEVSEMPYFFAPVASTHNFDVSNVNDIKGTLDWDHMVHVQITERVEWEHQPDEFFNSLYVTDPFDGGRKFYVSGIRKDLSPLDPVPDGTPTPRHKAWRELPHNILNYSISLWSRSRKSKVFREDQPVFQAELVPLRRNLLDNNANDEELKPKACPIVLECLRISAISTDIVAMAYNLPAIIYRMESNLIALEACRLFDLDLRPDLALEAVTKDSDNSEEHDMEKINFQVGMGSNYERLELLGDSFLKMSTTIALYTLAPDKNEFDYHVERMLLICNQNLFNNALDVKLEEYIRSKSFDRRTWYPEGLTLKRGKATDTSKNTHTLGDKSIADVCEAMIGAAYLTTYKERNMDMAIKAVTKVVKHKNHAMTSWQDFYDAYEKPGWQTAVATPAQLNLKEQIKKRVGYEFKWPRLLRTAFTHPSYPRSYEGLPSYQRLEFLGDALLDMVCVDYLFQRFPGADPQWLTEHKMAMVSNQFLGCLSVSLGFHKHMMAMNPQVQSRKLEYVQELEAGLQEAQAAAEAEGRPRDAYARDYWVRLAHPPKCLSDIVEAYIGALFVDSGYDYARVRHFFDRHVEPYFADMAPYDTYANKHPVTFLSNLMAHRFRCAEWRFPVREIAADEDAPVGETQVVASLMLHHKVAAYATAASGRYAKIACAKKAMRLLEDMAVGDFKNRFGCDCKWTPPDDTDADEKA